MSKDKTPMSGRTELFFKCSTNVDKLGISILGVAGFVMFPLYFTGHFNHGVAFTDLQKLANDIEIIRSDALVKAGVSSAPNYNLYLQKTLQSNGEEIEQLFVNISDYKTNYNYRIAEIVSNPNVTDIAGNATSILHSMGKDSINFSEIIQNYEDQLICIKTWGVILGFMCLVSALFVLACHSLCYDCAQRCK